MDSIFECILEFMASRHSMYLAVLTFLCGNLRVYQLRREDKSRPENQGLTFYRFLWQQVSLAIFRPKAVFALMFACLVMWPIMLVLIVVGDAWMFNVFTGVQQATLNRVAQDWQENNRTAYEPWRDPYLQQRYIDAQLECVAWADRVQGLHDTAAKISGFLMILFGVGLSIGAAVFPTPAKAQSKDKQTNGRPIVKDPLAEAGDGPDPLTFTLTVRGGARVLTEQRLAEPAVQTPLDQLDLTLKAQVRDDLSVFANLRMMEIGGDGEPVNLAFVTWNPWEPLTLQLGRIKAVPDLARSLPPHKRIEVIGLRTGIGSSLFDQGLRAKLASGSWILEVGSVTGHGLKRVAQDRAFDVFARAQAGVGPVTFGLYDQRGPQPLGPRCSTGGYTQFDLKWLFGKGELVQSMNPTPEGSEEITSAWMLLGGRPLPEIDLYGRGQFTETKGVPLDTANLLLGANWRPTDGVTLRIGADTTWELGSQARTRAPTAFGFHAAIQAIH